MFITDNSHQAAARLNACNTVRLRHCCQLVCQQQPVNTSIFSRASPHTYSQLLFRRTHTLSFCFATHILSASVSPHTYSQLLFNKCLTNLTMGNTRCTKDLIRKTFANCWSMIMSLPNDNKVIYSLIQLHLHNKSFARSTTKKSISKTKTRYQTVMDTLCTLKNVPLDICS